MNQCVLSAIGNYYANSNNIIFIIKDPKLYVPVVSKGQPKTIKTSEERIWRISVFKWMRTKMQQTSIDIFLESKFIGVNRLFVLIYLNQDDNAKGYSLCKSLWPNW